MRAFTASDGKTVSINVGAASARVLVANRNGALPVRIHNAGTATVWIRGGGSAVTATTSDIPIGPNGFTEIQTFAPSQGGDLYIAAIAAGATGYIYFTAGEGI